MGVVEKWLNSTPVEFWRPGWLKNAIPSLVESQVTSSGNVLVAELELLQ
jgi:hypothetical protein